MNWWALRISSMLTEKDLESAFSFVLDSKINKEYILDKTTEKLYHREKVGDWEGSFSLLSPSIQIFML